MHALKRKRKMTRKPRYVQLSQSAAIVFALAMVAVPAHSQTLDLNCLLAGSSSSIIRLSIDMKQSTVTIGYPGSQSSPFPATITEQLIKFSGQDVGNPADPFTGTLDRTTGTLLYTIESRSRSHTSFNCRRVTREF
jgi:hypothetical protein